jgi:hypothetical protein
VSKESPVASPFSEAEIAKLLAELEVPFAPQQVQWRVTNTSNDKKRGQIMPYADPRAYTDRLNALFSPQGWTRTYTVETLNNITRLKKGENVITGKVLVTCTVTIIGLWSHSGTGEEWADGDFGLTSADAQAFKRACSCFGLGRYFYDFNPPWVDLDQNRQPTKTPTLPAWAIPENWRKGMRPPGKHENNNAASNGSNGHGKGSFANDKNGDGQRAQGNGNDSTQHLAGADLDARILSLEKAIGTGLYRNILREYGRVNQPRLIRDLDTKRKVFQVLESATRGIERLNAITKRLDPASVASLLSKLQVPPVAEITDMKTLQAAVFGLEDLTGPKPESAGH